GLGCDAAKPTKVEGIVLLDGNPVRGAMVNFVPAGGEGRPASGLTGSDGVFRLTTYSLEDGALPGNYKVIVVKSANTGNVGEPRTAEQIKTMMMGGFKKADPKDDADQHPAPKDNPGKQPPPSKPSLLPELYGNLNTTTLEVTLPSKGKVVLELRSTSES